MITTITRSYTFESAHWLPKVPEGHKCRRMHGHSYRTEIRVMGEIDERGFVMDFAELDGIMDPLVKQLDHRCLNDVEGLENPTAEHIANWFLDKAEAQIDTSIRIAYVRVYETVRCYAEVLP
jgi:6-pyruvoyltetrahydropterin/6-carboxytetrahydropterin synthase